MDYKEFENQVQKKYGKGTKNFKVRGSWGIYDAYKHIRKNKWYDIGRPLTEHEFYTIVRSVNSLLATNIALGKAVMLPARMGKLELRKRELTPYINKNGVLRVPYPVDWNSTVRLWFEDKEARENKTLIRDEKDTIYSVKYNKYDATYQNKWFYEFTLNRFIKRALKDNINNGITDTIW